MEAGLKIDLNVYWYTSTVLECPEFFSEGNTSFQSERELRYENLFTTVSYHRELLSPFKDTEERFEQVHKTYLVTTRMHYTAESYRQGEQKGNRKNEVISSLLKYRFLIFFLTTNHL